MAIGIHPLCLPSTVAICWRLILWLVNYHHITTCFYACADKLCRYSLGWFQMPLPTNLLQILYGIALLYLPYIAEFEV